ncbi:MAG: 4Fe-4S binding protein [Limnochordia bacterium]|nr:4Fe-4S binding protein [Limnochordia bacterium]MDD2629960.1 4Fe-4S binding protein [Limnochordia bacterium]MDD4518588.1 4Fe-4S binding protein [Limnochordia bacterium]
MSNLLHTEYVGLHLKSPVIAASSNITGTVDGMKRCEDHGAGAVVMKSLFEQEVCRQAPTPRFHIIEHNLGSYKTWSFYSYEQASVWDVERYAEEIRRAKESLEIPVIASINCTSQEGWVRYAKMCEEAGADALELNVSCPHGSVTFRGLNVEEEIAAIVDLVRRNVSLPLVAKLSPMLTSPMNVALDVEKNGADAVVIFNRMTGLEIDADREEPVLHGGYAGHGGPWAIQYPLRWISQIYPRVECQISGSGGVAEAKDVVKYLLCGATVVQVCTAVFMQGYEVFARLNQGLEKHLLGKGYQNVGELRGRIIPKLKGTDQVDRRHWLTAHIDQDLCTRCGTCQRVCTFFAIDKSDAGYVVNDDCDGCGMCYVRCPKTAIVMVDEKKEVVMSRGQRR